MDINTLLADFKKSLQEEQGLAPSSVKRHYKPALRFISKYYANSVPGKRIDSTFLNDCFKKMTEIYSAGKISEEQFKKYRKCISSLKQYISIGVISHECLPALSFRIPMGKNEWLLKQFLELERHRLADTSLKRIGNTIRQFLLYLEDNDNQNLNELTPKTIIEFMEYMSVRRPAGLGAVVPAIRSFVVYLFKTQVIPQDLSGAANVPVTHKHKVHGIFTRSDLDHIFSQVDTTTPMGKRDFAIMMLASRNGLRSSDILNLKLPDIHWNKAEFSIIQKKTSIPLVCPMDLETGNAIADYILHARPFSNAQNIFLSVKQAQPITSSALCRMLKTYMLKAGIEKPVTERIGMHTFRRSLGTSLLENDVPLETIAQILGHKSNESTKQYLSISEQKLSECFLPMPITHLKGGGQNE